MSDELVRFERPPFNAAVALMLRGAVAGAAPACGLRVVVQLGVDACRRGLG